MNIIELKYAVEAAIDKAKETGIDPDSIQVSLQIEKLGSDVYMSTDKDIELIYDNNGMASGCVLYGLNY